MTSSHVGRRVADGLSRETQGIMENREWTGEVPGPHDYPANETEGRAASRNTSRIVSLM